MRAALCPRSFLFLMDGGVRVRWACGATLERPDETAVDVEILRDHIPQDHHHRHHLRHRDMSH